MAEKSSNLTVGELIEILAAYPDQYLIDFAGMDLLKIRQSGEARIRLELEPHVRRTHEERRIAEAM